MRHEMRRLALKFGPTGRNASHLAEHSPNQNAPLDAFGGRWRLDTNTVRRINVRFRKVGKVWYRTKIAAQHHGQASQPNGQHDDSDEDD